MHSGLKNISHKDNPVAVDSNIINDVKQNP